MCTSLLKRERPRAYGGGRCFCRSNRYTATIMGQPLIFVDYGGLQQLRMLSGHYVPVNVNQRAREEHAGHSKENCDALMP